MIDNLIAYIAKRANSGKERGASAVEYGLLIAGIAAVIIVAALALGPAVAKQFDDTCEKIQSPTGAATSTACAKGDGN